MVYPLTDQGQVVGKLILMPGAITPPVLTEQLATVAKLIVTTLQAAQMRQHLSKLAWRDDLSGLYNRRYFEQALDRLIETAANQRSQLTLLFFDIDDFKTYNDQYGHDTGDALIRELAELLRHSSRSG
jgi:two-component system cell cycle response regulator